MSGVIGIDPGKSGGIAYIATSRKCVEAAAMPATERDIFELLKRLARDSEIAVIEKVAAMPGQGVAGMFRFGQSYGFLRGCLTALEIPFEAISPVVWQRLFSLPTLKKSKSLTAKKNAHKARAQELFPSIKIKHATADALLIAEYGLRTRASPKIERVRL